MIISFATANLFHQPFETVLELVAAAGFQHIELDLYWRRKQWAMAQHLKDLPVKQAVRLVEKAGLQISSIHDGGGVLEQVDSARGYLNPTLDQALDAMGRVPGCLVFHTPHIEGDPGPGWWQRSSGEIMRLLEPYQKTVPIVTIENMPALDGYCVPLLTPEALRDFADENGLGVTLDTTHYAQIGTSIIEAARTLDGSLRSIHLSDYHDRKTHLFVGDGDLDFPDFFAVLKWESLYAITLECSLSTPEQPDRDMSRERLVARLREARLKVEAWVH